MRNSLDILIREYSHSGVVCVHVFEGVKVTYMSSTLRNLVTLKMHVFPQKHFDVINIVDWYQKYVFARSQQNVTILRLFISTCLKRARIANVIRTLPNLLLNNMSQEILPDFNYYVFGANALFPRTQSM
jgi:hypothetical protein